MALCGVVAVYGQDNMIINLADNSNVTIVINDIQRITFDEDNMLVKKTTGAENTYLLDNISCITFLDNPSVIHENKTIAEKTEVNFYLNSYGEIVVESPSIIRTLTVFDMTGRTVKTTHQSNMNVSFLTTGIYLLRIETDKGFVTKKFVKNR